MGALRAILVLGLLVNFAGCRQDSDPPTRPKNDDALTQSQSGDVPQATEDDEVAAARADAIQELGSLGYVDYSPEKADESKLGVVHIDPRRSYPGYNLYTHAGLPTAYLIDETGKVIKSWDHQLTETYCELLPNGDLLIPGKTPPEDRRRNAHYNRFLIRMSWDGTVIWKRPISAHHDVEITPRDQILTLSLDHVRLPIHPDGEVRENLLTLVSHDGEVIEKLPLYEVLSGRPDLFTLDVAGQKIHEGAKRSMDLFHANSIEWMRRKHLEARDPIYAPSNLLMSMRHQNAVVIINWDAKRLVWAWGPGEILGPHDASMLESGNILLFDNGLGREWSRVIELDPLTRKIMWEYKAPTPAEFYSATRGSSQRLENGNTLITNSNSGQVFEVTSDGEIVWEFLSPRLNDKGHRATIVRMKRYEREYVDRILRTHQPADAPPGP